MDRKTLLNFAKWLALDDRINLSFDQEGGPHYNPKTNTIHLPDNITEHSALACLAVIVHEASHTRAVREDTNCGFALMGLAKTPLDHLILNLAEDIRIDVNTWTKMPASTVMFDIIDDIFVKNASDVPPIHTAINAIYLEKMSNLWESRNIVRQKLVDAGIELCQIANATRHVESLMGSIQIIRQNLIYIKSREQYGTKIDLRSNRLTVKKSAQDAQDSLDFIKSYIKEFSEQLEKQNNKQSNNCEDKPQKSKNKTKQTNKKDLNDSKSDQSESDPSESEENTKPKKEKKAKEKQKTEHQYVKEYTESKKAMNQKFIGTSGGSRLFGHDLVPQYLIESQTKNMLVECLRRKYNKNINDGNVLNTDNLTSFHISDIENLFMDTIRKVQRKGRFYFVMDTSGSMECSRIAPTSVTMESVSHETSISLVSKMIRAIMIAVDEAINEGDEIDYKLYGYNDCLYPMDHKLLKTQIPLTTGGTCFAIAMKSLVKIAKEDTDVHEKMVIMLTDGEVHDSDVTEVKDICNKHGDIKFVIMSIGSNSLIRSTFGSDCIVDLEADANEKLLKQCLKILED